MRKAALGSTVSICPRAGRIAFDHAAAIEKDGQPPHRLGIAEFGGASQRLFGLGARYTRRPVYIAASERIVFIIEIKHRFGIVLRRRRAQLRNFRIAVSGPLCMRYAGCNGMGRNRAKQKLRKNWSRHRNDP